MGVGGGLYIKLLEMSKKYLWFKILMDTKGCFQVVSFEGLLTPKEHKRCQSGDLQRHAIDTSQSWDEGFDIANIGPACRTDCAIRIISWDIVDTSFLYFSFTDRLVIAWDNLSKSRSLGWIFFNVLVGYSRF